MAVAVRRCMRVLPSRLVSCIDQRKIPGWPVDALPAGIRWGGHRPCLMRGLFVLTLTRLRLCHPVDSEMRCGRRRSFGV